MAIEPMDNGPERDWGMIALNVAAGILGAIIAARIFMCVAVGVCV